MDGHIEIARNGRRGYVIIPDGIRDHIGEVELRVAIEPQRRR